MIAGPMTMPKRLIILGATGSIGDSALDVVRAYPGEFEVVGLSAHANVEKLAALASEFKPRFVAISDTIFAGSAADQFAGADLLTGPDGVEALAAHDVDVVLCGMVGAAGLRPILSAIRAGNRVAIANKEPLVMAGALVMEEARRHGVDVLPVDSEHNAIFQCLHGEDVDHVECIHLTASGGPFYKRSRESLMRVTPEEATNHPTWDMGAKISVDSATLMNKGLEVIEAHWLFNLPLSKIRVVIHPQSIVHSLVEFTDGSILAHLGLTDMKFPIQYALTWPERVSKPLGRLDLTEMTALTFDKPDFDQFPCLQLALDAATAGGTAPAILNAANETAVAAFRTGELRFLDIADTVKNTLDACPVSQDVTLESVLDADRAGRECAVRRIASRGVA
jgi:1-deoxy-D-xylulose-5-phosphate reductoisomerase